MAIEFSWVPDRDLSSQTDLDISVVSFGDGYEQRMPKSINPVKQTWSLNFKNRTTQEISDIVTFLQKKGGVIAFRFQDYGCPPCEAEAKVVCNGWNTTIPIQGYQSLSCTFRRVPV